MAIPTIFDVMDMSNLEIYHSVLFVVIFRTVQCVCSKTNKFIIDWIILC